MRRVRLSNRGCVSACRRAPKPPRHPSRVSRRGPPRLTPSSRGMEFPASPARFTVSRIASYRLALRRLAFVVNGSAAAKAAETLDSASVQFASTIHESGTVLCESVSRAGRADALRSSLGSLEGAASSLASSARGADRQILAISDSVGSNTDELKKLATATAAHAGTLAEQQSTENSPSSSAIGAH